MESGGVKRIASLLVWPPERCDPQEKRYPRGPALQQTRGYQHVDHRRANFDSLSLLARHTSAQVLEHWSVASYCRRGRSGKRVCIVPFEILRVRFGVRLDGWPTHWGDLGSVAGS